MATTLTSALRSAVGAPTASSIKANCRKVICIGRNYADHISELNNTKPKQPFFFLKPPSSILLPTDGPVLRPRGVNLHFEIELALIMGKRVRDLDPSDEATALAFISHYCLAIDMTGRNVQEEAKRKGLPWDIAKGFHTFLPLSAPIPASRLPDPYAAEIWLKVNGTTKQEDSVGLMLFRIPRMMADVSRVMDLEEGDVVLTGTPKGVGPVGTGDVMTAGMRLRGQEIAEVGMEVGVVNREGPYEYAET